MDDLIALAERCEAATGADREMDGLIHIAAGEELASYRRTKIAEVGVYGPSYTASLDDAMSLVPEGMVVLITNTGISGRGADLSLATAHVGLPNDRSNDPSEARSMALALTAASLRARAAALKLEG